MGGGTYTYLTIPGQSDDRIVHTWRHAHALPELLPDQVKAGTIDIKFVDETVKTMLRTKFALGLFESMYHSRVT